MFLKNPLSNLVFNFPYYEGTKKKQFVHVEG